MVFAKPVTGMIVPAPAHCAIWSYTLNRKQNRNHNKHCASGASCCCLSKIEILYKKHLYSLPIAQIVPPTINAFKQLYSTGRLGFLFLQISDTPVVLN